MICTVALKQITFWLIRHLIINTMNQIYYRMMFGGSLVHPLKGTLTSLGYNISFTILIQQVWQDSYQQTARCLTVDRTVRYVRTLLKRIQWIVSQLYLHNYFLTLEYLLVYGLQLEIKIRVNSEIGKMKFYSQMLEIGVPWQIEPTENLLMKMSRKSLMYIILGGVKVENMKMFVGSAKL